MSSPSEVTYDHGTLSFTNRGSHQREARPTPQSAYSMALDVDQRIANLISAIRRGGHEEEHSHSVPLHQLVVLYADHIGLSCTTAR